MTAASAALPGVAPGRDRVVPGPRGRTTRARGSTRTATIYDGAVRGPLESLLAEVQDEFGEGKVARPNRDTRFSRDKSPYKLQVYATIPRAEGGGGWYVQLREDGLFVGGGLYAPDRAALAALRAAIDDERTGTGARAHRGGARGRRDRADGVRALKTAPRGYPADHPRIRLPPARPPRGRHPAPGPAVAPHGSGQGPRHRPLAGARPVDAVGC